MTSEPPDADGPMSVLVTGGGTGIGAATAHRFAAHGAQVTICGRRREPVERTAAAIGRACRAVVADVTVAADRQRVIDAAVEHGGGIDVLVHAAANMYRGPLPELEEQQLLGLFHGNVVAPMLLTAAALPHLIARRGAVVLFGSVHVARAFPGASPYAASKGAVETLAAVLAAELGPQGVRVNAIRPGGVHTELNQRAGVVADEAEALARLQSLAPAHALGRIGTVDEVAEAVEYLAHAKWTTGSVLVVDGGLGLGVTNA